MVDFGRKIPIVEEVNIVAAKFAELHFDVVPAIDGSEDKILSSRIRFHVQVSPKESEDAIKTKLREELVKVKQYADDAIRMLGG